MRGEFFKKRKCQAFSTFLHTLITFSPGAEGADRNLVPELAAVFAAELLALLTCKETLVFVHIPILHLHNMRELAALADLVDNAGVINQKVPRK